MPKRLQRKRAKGWRMPAGTVYVGRPTKWGNPWSPANTHILTVKGGRIEKVRDTTVADCVRAYRESVLDGSIGLSVEMIRAELRGKDLACWCPPGSPCHADVLIELA